MMDSGILCVCVSSSMWWAEVEVVEARDASRVKQMCQQSGKTSLSVRRKKHITFLGKAMSDLRGGKENFLFSCFGMECRSGCLSLSYLWSEVSYGDGIHFFIHFFEC